MGFAIICEGRESEEEYAHVAELISVRLKLTQYCESTVCVRAQFLSGIQLCNLRAVARQAPPSMGLPSKNAGVGSHVLLQGIFLTRGPNPRLPCLLHWQVDSLPLSHKSTILPLKRLKNFKGRKNRDA